MYVLLMILLTALLIAFTLKPQPGSAAAEFALRPIGALNRVTRA